MQSTFKIDRETKAIRIWIVFFMIVLFLSGVTAIPAEWELSRVIRFFPSGSTVRTWLNQVYKGIRDTGNQYPFLFYGYDWLAFAHFVLALLFIGPYKHPVRNKWIIEFGIYACLLIIPFALVAGHFRGIPFWWRLLDCSFGVLGLIPLAICYRKIMELESISSKINEYETV